MMSLKIARPAARVGIAVAIFLPLILNGCGGYSASATYTNSATLTGITITPSSETLTTGAAARLTAIGSYSNLTTADITSSVTWSSAASGTASVSSGGIVTGNAVGATTVTAAISSGSAYGGGVISASDTITVTAATLTGIAITPLTNSVAKGTATTFTATGTFSDGTTGNVSGAVSWTSSDMTVATINASGIATGVNTGTTTITASSGGVSNTATLTVP